MLLALAFAAALAADPPAAPLTLAEAVGRARADSPVRHSAAALASGTADAARYSSHFLNPSVDARAENFSLSGPPALPLDVFAVVNQPLELAGKRGLRRDIAEADRDVAATALQTLDRAIALRTVQIYLHALKARGVLATLTENREGLTTIIDSMRRRVTEGYAAASDLLKFETESARTDNEIARATLDLERSLHGLTFVIGASIPITPAQLVDPPVLDAPLVDEAALPRIVERHPEVETATARLARARAAASLERSRRIPDPIVTAGFKRTSGLGTAVAGVLVPVPLFDQNRPAVARALGEERAAAAERDAIVRRLASETAALLTTAQVLSAQAARASRDLLTPAETVRRAARAAFREGAVDVLRLIDAERVYSDVRRAALELRLDALAATIEARFAIGDEVVP